MGENNAPVRPVAAEAGGVATRGDPNPCLFAHAAALRPTREQERGTPRLASSDEAEANASALALEIADATVPAAASAAADVAPVRCCCSSC